MSNFSKEEKEQLKSISEQFGINSIDLEGLFNAVRKNKSKIKEILLRDNDPRKNIVLIEK
jgi:hypothetical protein